jgi:hypothetical protein
VNNASRAALGAVSSDIRQWAMATCLSEGIRDLVDVCDVARIERDIKMALDYVEGGHCIPSVQKLLDDVAAEKAAAANDQVGVLRLGHEREK